MRVIGIGKGKWWCGAALLGAVVAALVLVPRAAAFVDAAGGAGAHAPDTEDDAKATTITTGSGTSYTTTVKRVPGGALSDEDFRQVSLLASRIVMHLNKAATQLGLGDLDAARRHVTKGLSLVGVVRDLLPTTTVTTIVRDAGGETVYRNVDRVQDDRIPLHEGLIAMEVLEPVADAKQEDLGIQGVRLADAQLVHTSVLVELGYVERKLQRIESLLDEDVDAALAEALLAQARGISFAMNEEDTPLVEAQSALQLAERMVEQERYQAARENLALARDQLDLYASLEAVETHGEVAQLREEITRLMKDIERDDGAETIRGFWDRVTSWFTREPGETRSSADTEPSET